MSQLVSSIPPTMARFLRFLEIHEPDALVVESFFFPLWSAPADDENSLRACDRDARELTELFVPTERLSHDAIEM
jgi:hypothetical protein